MTGVIFDWKGLQAPKQHLPKKLAQNRTEGPWYWTDGLRKGPALRISHGNLAITNATPYFKGVFGVMGKNAPLPTPYA